PSASPGALTLLPPFSLNSITVADPQMRTPKVNMWGLSIERQIANNTVFSLTYNGRHGVGLYSAYDANQVNYTTNGFLDAFKIVQASGQRALFDQLFTADTRRTGMTGADSARATFPALIGTGRVPGRAFAIA